ncbi:MAG: hypothetical protein AB1831_04440 [Pseudomonadota bacterium]
MKTHASIPTLGALAVIALLGAAPAQACMPFFSSGAASGQPACAASAAGPRTCTLGGGAAPGRGCAPASPEMLGAMGGIAAGGMQIATHMMQVLAGEVGRYAALDGAAR